MYKTDDITLILQVKKSRTSVSVFCQNQPLSQWLSWHFMPAWLPIISPPSHHHLIMFFIALNFANLSFILRSYFDAWKGLPNAILTFLICLIFAEYKRDFRQFSNRLKWMSCWIMPASFSRVLYQQPHLSGFFFFPKFKDCLLFWFLSLRSFDFLVWMPFDHEHVTSITCISFVNFIYLTLTRALKIATDPFHGTTKERAQ